MARTFAALLVDSDLKGLESLVYGFQGVDWRSTACPAPETAAFLIKASGASIVIVASREPHDKTLALLQQLRANQETSSIPLLVIGPASLREGVNGIGTIDYLPTPVFVRDVITASRILVSQSSDPEPKIDGNLSEFGLFSILRAMSNLMRSGVLQAERAGRRGEVLFSDGDVTGAQVGSLQGSAAIHHLLLWEDAKIELRLRPVARRSSFNRRFEEIMDEAERFVRDYTHAIQAIGPSSAVYEKNEAKLTGATGSVPSEIMPVIRLFDGQRTLADIVDQSPFRVFDTVRILTRLVELGVLTRQASKAGSSPIPPLQKFWETARIAGPEEDATPVSVRKSASMPVSGLDGRIGDPNRRKLQRRARAETPVLGTPLADLEAADVPADNAAAPSPSPDSLAAPVAPVAGVARTSGTIQLRSAVDQRQARADRRNRPSVSIDVGLIEAAMESAPPAETPAAAPAAQGRLTGSMQVTPSSHRRSGTHSKVEDGSVSVDPALAKEAELAAKKNSASAPVAKSKKGATPAPVNVATSAPEAAAPAPAPTQAAPASPLGSGSVPAGDGARTSRATGTLSIASSQRTVAPKSLDKGFSVELDPVLVAELDRLERATTPIGPPESALRTGSQPVSAQPEPASPVAEMPAAPSTKSDATKASASTPAPSGARVTGTLSISTSSRSSAHARKASPANNLSVSLDPGLVEEAQKLDAPNPPPTATPVHGTKEGSKPAAAGQAQDAASEGGPASTRPAQPPPPHAPDGSAPAPSGKSGSRISGAFSAIESDFFAREADLYKSESADNFSDLDEPAGRSGVKTSNGRRQSKR